MSEDNIVITSNMKHAITIGLGLFAMGGTWATLKADVKAVQKEDIAIFAKIAKTDEKIEALTSDLNKQAVTIGGIVVTTKNIEKQMEAQQRILERISQQLPRPR